MAESQRDTKSMLKLTKKRISAYSVVSRISPSFFQDYIKGNKSILSPLVINKSLAKKKNGNILLKKERFYSYAHIF